MKSGAVVMGDAYWCCCRAFNRATEFLECLLAPRRWKYWIVRPKTLRIGYHDTYDVYLHTSMQILCDFYHNELICGNVDWNWDVTYQDAWATIEEIASWWENEFPKYEDVWELPPTATAEQYEELLSAAAIAEIEQNDKILSMLLKLAEVSPFLSR